jgi:integrase
VALETGLTQGDLLALRWSSVNLKEGWIRVSRSKTKVEAVIPISDLCREALSECLRRPVVGEKVFLTEIGQPFSVTAVNRYFAKAKTLAEITRRLRFHDLRHSFASLLASKGVSIQVIAKALGHSSPRMAERYARPSEESLKAITEALNSSKPGSASSVRNGKPSR